MINLPGSSFAAIEIARRKGLRSAFDLASAKLFWRCPGISDFRFLFQQPCATPTHQRLMAHFDKNLKAIKLNNHLQVSTIMYKHKINRICN